MKKRKKSNNNLIFILSLIFILVIILIVVFTFILGKTNETYKTEYLNNINYILDNDIYYKNLTNNTMDDYYNSSNKNIESSFLEYKYELNTNTFYETKLNYSNNIYTSLIYSYFLNSPFINSTYEIKTGNSSIIINGIYSEQNNSISCNIENISNYHSNINKDVYCKTISDNINDFITERNNFINDSRFISILQNEYIDVVIGEE